MILYLLIILFCLKFEVFQAEADIESLIPQIGGTFCKYLAYKNILPRKYLRTCPNPTCAWGDWSHAAISGSSTNKTSNADIQEVANTATMPLRVVVSYGHNGFGNQLWQHSVAFMIAESLKAKLYIATIPESLSPGGVLPPNTWQGVVAMSKLLPDEFEYDLLPEQSGIRKLCSEESFYLADRPVDWRNRSYASTFRQELYDLVRDPRPRCLKLLGYFQNLPLCDEDARTLWTSRLLANVTLRPGEHDVSIYLRCLPRHYHFNDRHYYESILNHTEYDRIWLFMAPECPSKLSNQPEKDGVVASVLRMLIERYNASRWPSYIGEDRETGPLLHDLAGLITSKKVLLL